MNSMANFCSGSWARSSHAFLLRFQEAIKSDDVTWPAVNMGTRTVTEVRQEAADADPGSYSYFIFERERF